MHPRTLPAAVPSPAGCGARDSLVAHEIRVVDFGGLQIAYDARVLEPRAWTTAQAQWAAEILPRLPEGPVLELCAGAGQIGLLAVAESDRHLVSVEREPVAAAYAAANALGARIANRVEIREGHVRETLLSNERFPLVLADPPWVRSNEVASFPDDPPTAIDGGPEGLDVARECLAVIEAHLAPGGAALLQLGTEEQCAAVEELTAGRLEPGDRRVYPGQGVLLRLDRSSH